MGNPTAFKEIARDAAPYRDVEELLVERGNDVDHVTIYLRLAAAFDELAEVI